LKTGRVCGEYLCPQIHPTLIIYTSKNILS